MMTSDVEHKRKVSRWHHLWQPQKKWYYLHMPAGGLLMFAVGIIFWGGFNTVLEATNNEEFCITCHEMRDNVYMEYQKTIHYKNPAGVRATCPDCHVPRPWIYKMKRKIQASNEVLHKLLGTIDTREKFLGHRAELAQHVWDAMKETDSRECRNCHGQSFMNIPKQGQMAQKKHSTMQEEGKTCIDCHKGIAHKLPRGEELPSQEPPKADEKPKGEEPQKGVEKAG